MKKALLVGLNKYKQPGSDLRGCVNDVTNMRTLLSDTYKFKLDNIRLLFDSRATKKGIINRLNWLVLDAKPGDELVFHYSGHGSQVRDRNGDELKDNKDEILCPHDLDWNDPFTDDILAGIFKKLTKGAFLTVLIDACHSGSMTRSFFVAPEYREKSKKSRDRFLVPPIDIQHRSHNIDISTSGIGKKQNSKGYVVDQNHVLISGCRDNQTSADAYIDRKYQGAFTAMLLKAIYNNNQNKTWEQIHRGVKKRLCRTRYSQIPQLSGNSNLITRPIFGGTK